MMRRKLGSLLAAGALALTANMTIGSGTASAATTFTYGTSQYGPTIKAYVNGQYAAEGTWTVDPIAGNPGDTIVVTDLRTDGQHITGYLARTNYTVVRTATTKGKPAPSYDSASGDLTEGSRWKFWICYGTDASDVCSQAIDVHA
ncbi:hypothetical protein ACFWIA_14090 [Streptomyces sp. NPDC127068]|uniref:hypothetical protein n=1 Tax=Streptomyces sp. NPDC127068 TaxID=3347127 RepID=UPI003667A9D4